MYQDGQLATPYQRSYTSQENARPAGPKRISASVACGLLLPLDFAILSGAALFAYLLHLSDDPYANWASYGLVSALGVLLAVNIFQLSGLYDPQILQHKRHTYQRLITGWIAVAASLTMISFLAKTSDDYSRVWAMLWFGLGFVTLVGSRAVFFARANRWVAQGRLQNNVAILGSGHLAEKLFAHFDGQTETGLHIAGLFSDTDRNSYIHDNRRVREATLDDLISRVRRDHIDTVVIAISKLTRRRLQYIMERLRDVPVDIRVCPNSFALGLAQSGVSHIGGLPLLNAIDRPLSNWRLAAKEVEDRILAFAILTLISPLLVVISAAIKLDSPGPVVFRQKRYGYNNQLITVFKFRTMRQEQQDQWASQLTRRNDPRITRIGAFLRRTSLDELPQFFNVLRGEMSIVGPRPHAISAKAGGVLYHDAVNHYAARHRVKPGITGWAQINGWRGTTDTVRQIEKRVEHDLYYIENWSVWLDLKIIVLTVFKGFSGANAY